MKPKLPHLFSKKILFSCITLLAIVGFALGYRSYLLAQELKAVNERLTSSTNVSEIRTKRFEDALAEAKKENTELADALKAQGEHVNTLVGQMQEITGTVYTLQKLNRTDRELLKKYSKVYFLNEHYIPAALSPLDAKDLNASDKPEHIHASVLPFLTALLEEATGTHNDLRIISAYRSFGTQSSLKSAYKFTYGAGTANRFSADQGYSEHQLGTTVDFTTPTLGAAFLNFGETTAYAWLTENAYRYGFTLSYPEHNSYYIYEPWHWRFVGLKLAQKLHADNKYFYDMDQREIDTYLVNIFDADK